MHIYGCTGSVCIRVFNGIWRSRPVSRTTTVRLAFGTDLGSDYLSRRVRPMWNWPFGLRFKTTIDGFFGLGPDFLDRMRWTEYLCIYVLCLQCAGQNKPNQIRVDCMLLHLFLLWLSITMKFIIGIQCFNPTIFFFQFSTCFASLTLDSNTSTMHNNQPVKPNACSNCFCAHTFFTMVLFLSHCACVLLHIQYTQRHLKEGKKL